MLLRPWTWEKADAWDRLAVVFQVCSIVVGSICYVYEGNKKIIIGVTAASFATLSVVFKWYDGHLQRKEKKNRDVAERLAAEEREKEASAKTYKAVKAILDDLRDKLFRDCNDGDDISFNRVTLFRGVDYPTAGPACKKLQIFARAGDHIQSSTSWLVDDNDSSRCRGVAGQVWTTRLKAFKLASCGWPTDGNPDQKKKYANSLGITVEEAEKLNVKSVSFLGYPVLVRGSLWGVLLVDRKTEWEIKMKPKGPRDGELIENYSVIIGKVIGELI